MSALDDDTALGTVYESSTTLFSNSESTSLYSSNNGDVMAGPPSVVTNPESTTSSKTKAPGVRQRITLVCAECKRLKLRCDRRTPCNQCLKRDTVDKCIYHQAASEKIDLQSLNNRVLSLEHKTSSIPAPSVPNGRPTDPINPGAAASAKHRHAFSGDNDGTSTLLALGAHGASVAINLDGPTGLWIDDLGFDMTTGDAPSNSERPSETSGISLQPVTSIPDAGLLDFLSTFTQYFRLPSSSSGTGADDEFNLPDDDGARIGVTPRAVFKLPPAHIRAQIYPRLEAAHIMAPCVNYLQFRRRMEGMFRWAEIASGLSAGDSGAASLHGDDSDIEPMRSPPTLSFYAAAAAALAMGAQCWLFERNLGYCSEGSTTTAPSRTDGHASPTPASGTASSNMPPPISASEGYNRCDAGIGTVPPVMISDALPYTLFRIAKLALFLNTERAGYQSLDLDYVYAKTVLARLFLLAHSGPTDNDYSLLTSSPTRKTVRPRKSMKGKGRGSAGPTSSSASGVDSSMSEDMGSGSSSRNANAGPKESDRLPTLALDPELIGLVGEVVSNARLMGLSTDPDLAGGNKLSLYEKEMRRRLWWEVVSIDSFVSDCVGQHPLIHLQECSTRLPADVDEELFDPSSINLPPPNIESMHGNIEYYIRKLRLLRLNKDVKKRMDSIKNLNPELSPSDLLTHLSPMLDEFNDWLVDLPDHLQLKDNPSPITQSFASMNMSDMSQSSRTPSSPDDTPLLSPTTNENPGGFADRESPFVISMRCDLIISANYSLLRAMLPLVKNTGDGKPGKIDKFHCLHLMEPATAIIATWTYLHSAFKHIRPSMFMCYSFTRNLFDSSVTLAHLAIIQPMIAASAMPSLECAIEVLKDPSVLTGHLSAANKDNFPSEAVRIVGALIQKIHDARRGPGFTGSKRKHEDIDTSTIHLTNFRLPYVGAGVICTNPSSGSGATFVVPQNPPDSSSNGSISSRKTKDSTQSRTARTKKSPVSKDAPSAPAEHGPPTVKQKTTQNGQVTVRRRVAKKPDAARARAGSTTAGSVERASSIAAPSVPPAPPAPPAPPVPSAQPAPTPQAPQIVPTHTHHGGPATSVYYPQTPSVARQSLDNFTMQPHTASSPDFVSATGYRSDGMYSTAMASYSHPQTYADHHRVSLPVTVPSQAQHGHVNYDGFQGSSSVPVSAAQVRSHQPFPTAADAMDFTVAAQHPPELDMLGHSSRSEAHYQGRGSIDHGQPSGQPLAQQYHQQMQVPQPMPRDQEPQPWPDSSTYSSWSYPN